MNDQAREDTITKLRKKLFQAAYDYYEKGTSALSDSEYDMLMEQLKNMSPTDKLLNQIGTIKLGKGDSVKHITQMYSLNKYREASNEYDNLVSFLKGCNTNNFLIEPKIDGCAAEIVYKDGNFMYAATRGDGTEGHIITRHIAPYLPKNIPLKGTVAIYGEVVISYTEFERINQASALTTYANPRNLCAGTLSSLEVTERKLEFIAYNAYGIHCLQLNQLYELLNEWGFTVVNYNKASIDTLESDIRNAKDNYKEGNYDFPTDGIVLKVCDMELQQELGYSSTAPKWAIAYKFASEVRQTTIREIQWSLSRFGKLTPVAIIDPLWLAGTKVSRVNLHHAGRVAQRKLGVGAVVTVTKRNEIIPDVVDVIEGVPFLLPGFIQCPACGMPASLEAGGLADMSIYRCNNKRCIGSVSAAVNYVCSIHVLNVKGIGPSQSYAIATELLKHNVENPDLFKYISLIITEGLSDKRFSFLREKLLNMTFDQFLLALQIPHFNYQLSEYILCSYPTYKEFEEELMTSIDSVRLRTGLSGGDSFRWYFEEIKKVILNNKEVINLLSLENAYYKSKHTVGPLSGKNIVITGTFAEGRSIIASNLKALGANIQHAVSSTTSYILIGEKPGLTKVRKGEKLGIKFIKESELNTLIPNT